MYKVQELIDSDKETFYFNNFVIFIILKLLRAEISS